MAKKKALNELPAELVEEILVRLPVKSLLRFSSVSKAWESIISESGFAKRYRVHEGREKNIAIGSGMHRSLGGVHCFKIDPVPSYTVFSSSSSSSSMVSSSSSSTELVLPENNKSRILAFCDELWLVSSYDWKSFFLWNPSTRRHKKLPIPSILPKYQPNVKTSPIRFREFHYGIGYDSVGDDYKILKIPKRICLENPSYPSCDVAELYSLRSDSWRVVPDFPRNINWITCSVCLSGKIHWLPHGLAHSPGIISFDLSTDKFGEVIGPPLDTNRGGVISSRFGSRFRMAYNVSVLRGKLCVSATDFVYDKCEIWMMEEYGVASSWTIKFSFKNLGSIFQIDALCVLENGLILVNGYSGNGLSFFNRDRVFVVHQEEDGKSRLQQLTCGRSSFVSVGIVYVDSLVAPDAFNSSKNGNLPSHYKRLSVDGLKLCRTNKRTRPNGQSMSNKGG